MITEDMIHGPIARPPRRRIQNDTPIVPRAVAEAVWEEACVWLGEELPREWVRRLAVRADVTYTRNVSFRRHLQRSGDSGRDCGLLRATGSRPCFASTAPTCTFAFRRPTMWVTRCRN